MNTKITIIGAGLAGCEAALTLANNGFKVELHDLKPLSRVSGYLLDTFCELICNNSLCSLVEKSPKALLFTELTRLKSSLIPLINKSLVEDKNNLSVDKRTFSVSVTNTIARHPNISIISEDIKTVPTNRPLIIATGALTTKSLLKDLSSLFSDLISIQDTSCPVVDIGTIDTSQMNSLSDDLFEILLSQGEYEDLEKLLASSSSIRKSEADTNLDLQQCMPVEMLAKVNSKLLRELRLQPSKEGYATITLRKDDRLTNSAVISGFTTRMKNSDQERVIRSLRGMEKAKIVRYGRMHVNSFLDSPRFLSNNYEVKSQPDLYIIGQLSGVDGYLAAISSAVVACNSIINKAICQEVRPFPCDTIIGGLAKYVSTPSCNHFYPMTASYSLFSEQFTSDEDTFHFGYQKLDEWLQSGKECVV